MLPSRLAQSSLVNTVVTWAGPTVGPWDRAEKWVAAANAFKPGSQESSLEVLRKESRAGPAWV